MAAYVIQAGDTPLGIARKFGMSFDQFKAVNPGLCAAK
jgi:LysM repeat protein